MTDQLTQQQREALKLARVFHDTYERLAPEFGYTTRKSTRKFDPHSSNGQLMVAVCKEILNSTPAPNVGAMADALGERLRKEQAVFLTHTTLVDLVRAMLAAAPTPEDRHD